MKRVNKRVAGAAVSCAVIAISSLMVSAQRPSTTFPVIVVFEAHAPFQNYEREYRPDERAQANPAAWGICHAACRALHSHSSGATATGNLSKDGRPINRESVAQL